jgi:hypothetical protein
MDSGFRVKIYDCDKWHNFLKIFFLNFLTTIVQIYYIYNQKDFGVPDQMSIIKTSKHTVKDIPDINWIIFIIGGVSLFIHSLLMWLLSIISYFIDHRLMTKISYLFLSSTIFWQILGCFINYLINKNISVDVSSFGFGSTIGLIFIMIFLIASLIILGYRKFKTQTNNIDDDFIFR